MLTLGTARAAFRIPWIRRNLGGFRFLWSTFHLLLALYRSRRYGDFYRVLGTFLEMAHSFAQYGRVEAMDTIDRLLEIPWFAGRRRELLGLVRTFNQLVEALGLRGATRPPVEPALRHVSRTVDEFVRSVKTVLGFDEEDEERVRALLAREEDLEEALEAFTAASR
jgi:hypothetical protein